MHILFYCLNVYNLQRIAGYSSSNFLKTSFRNITINQTRSNVGGIRISLSASIKKFYFLASRYVIHSGRGNIRQKIGFQNLYLKQRVQRIFLISKKRPFFAANSDYHNFFLVAPVARLFCLILYYPDDLEVLFLIYILYYAY